MTDKYTIEEIKAVFAATVGSEAKGCCAATGQDWEDFERELTKPAYEFRDGEVIETGGSSGNWSYVRYEADKMDLTGRERPLRLSEMPKAVEDLREALETCKQGGEIIAGDRALRIIAAFDEAIKP